MPREQPSKDVVEKEVAVEKENTVMRAVDQDPAVEAMKVRLAQEVQFAKESECHRAAEMEKIRRENALQEEEIRREKVLHEEENRREKVLQEKRVVARDRTVGLTDLTSDFRDPGIAAARDARHADDAAVRRVKDVVAGIAPTRLQEGKEGKKGKEGKEGKAAVPVRASAIPTPAPAVEISTPDVTNVVLNAAKYVGEPTLARANALSRLEKLLRRATTELRKARDKVDAATLAGCGLESSQENAIACGLKLVELKRALDDLQGESWQIALEKLVEKAASLTEIQAATREATATIDVSIGLDESFDTRTLRALYEKIFGTIFPRAMFCAVIDAMIAQLETHHGMATGASRIEISGVSSVFSNKVFVGTHAICDIKSFTSLRASRVQFIAFLVGDRALIVDVGSLHGVELVRSTNPTNKLGKSVAGARRIFICEQGEALTLTIPGGHDSEIVLSVQAGA
jgi:hypothetical protein